jgi:hypothetical protein
MGSVYIITAQHHSSSTMMLIYSLNGAPRHEGVLGEWGYSAIHSLTSALDGGEWSASSPSRFTLQGKSPWYPLDKRLGRSQSLSERGSKEKRSLPLPGLDPPIIQPVAQRYTTQLFRLILLHLIHIFEIIFRRHEEQVKFWECLLPFSSESFSVFPYPI